MPALLKIELLFPHNVSSCPSGLAASGLISCGKYLFFFLFVDMILSVIVVYHIKRAATAQLQPHTRVTWPTSTWDVVILHTVSLKLQHLHQCHIVEVYFEVTWATCRPMGFQVFLFLLCFGFLILITQLLGVKSTFCKFYITDDWWARPSAAELVQTLVIGLIH